MFWVTRSSTYRIVSFWTKSCVSVSILTSHPLNILRENHLCLRGRGFSPKLPEMFHLHPTANMISNKQTHICQGGREYLITHRVLDRVGSPALRTVPRAGWPTAQAVQQQSSAGVDLRPVSAHHIKNLIARRSR